MINKGRTEIVGAAAGRTILEAIIKGRITIWQAARSCFSKGGWKNERPWRNDEPWINQ